MRQKRGEKNSFLEKNTLEVQEQEDFFVPKLLEESSQLKLVIILRTTLHHSALQLTNLKWWGWGCIVQSQHTCFSPSSPGFNSRRSQECFS